MRLIINYKEFFKQLCKKYPDLKLGLIIESHKALCIESLSYKGNLQATIISEIIAYFKLSKLSSLIVMKCNFDLTLHEFTILNNNSYEYTNNIKLKWNK